MAFVVVQHLAPDDRSEMAELLQNHCPSARSRMGSGYASTTSTRSRRGRQLTLENGTLRLSPAEGKDGHVLSPIDAFFRSLADELGERAACVILSGTGTDGTLGLRAIKEAGGLTLVQHPEDADYDGMPRSAVGAGLADTTDRAAGRTARRLQQRVRDPGLRRGRPAGR